MSEQLKDRFQIIGGSHLTGEVSISGAKNSILKLMAVSLMAAGKYRLGNVPAIADVTMMGELLESLGCKVIHDESKSELLIEVPEQPGFKADYQFVRKLRASINVLGPLVAKLGRAEVALPGGDAIGSRGLDIHTRGLKELGAVTQN